ncbi:HlyD family secretion protein [Desulfomicrobium escambiense]|uniref:HlyD family secretion protein n=1 Tax=Desulfomicrobium escambiense TaxID=29503 RepID=UPI000401A3DE|nr:HlyD family secretion protein [Desulfomicrobium escambiense]
MTTANDAGPANARPGRKRMILLAVLALVAGFGLVQYVRGMGKVSTDDAFVDGRIYQITPRVAGYIVQDLVEDNQLVEEGQPLLTLDPVGYEVAVAQARADLAAAEAQLASLRKGVPLQKNQTEFQVAGARAQLESLMKSLDQARLEEAAAGQLVLQAEAELRNAELNFTRLSELRAGGIIAQSALDEAQTALDAARARTGAARDRAQAAGRNLASLGENVARLQANIDLARTGHDVADIKDLEVAAQQARVELARERVRKAELDLGYTRILAPAKGHVTKKKIQAGQLVDAGQPLMALVPLDPGELWVTANFKETQLARVRPGQKVDLEVDTFPGREFTGRVESVMAGTGAVFSLFPPENAMGNYVKVVQRIPVKIALDPVNGTQQLRLGMSVVPTIHLD